MHAVCGLECAQWSGRSPWGHSSPRGRTAAQRAGLAFQKKVTAALKGQRIPLQAGPWISYEDRTGRHAAQPDLVLWPDSPVPVLVEVKYTYTPVAWDQIFSLYLPLLECLLPEKEAIVPVVLCKKLVPEAAKEASCIQALGALRSKEDFFPRMVLTWDARAPLALRALP